MSIRHLATSYCLCPISGDIYSVTGPFSSSYKLLFYDMTCCCISYLFRLQLKSGPFWCLFTLLLRIVLATIQRICTEVQRKCSPASKCRHDILCRVIIKAPMSKSLKGRCTSLISAVKPFFFFLWNVFTWLSRTSDDGFVRQNYLVCHHGNTVMVYESSHRNVF